MRICFFGNPHSPQLRRTVASLADRDCTIHVVHHEPATVPRATYEPYAIPSPGLRHPHRWPQRRHRYLSGFLRRYDVVSVQFLHDWGFTPELMAAGCFTVRPWGSDVSPPPGAAPPRQETLVNRRSMLRAARGVQVTCASFRATVARFADLDEQRMTCTPLGVDLGLFRPGRYGEGPPVVGFLKGFGHAYGPQRLIRAMPHIVAAHPRVQFDLVGDGPLRGRCLAAAQELGVGEHIRWLDRMPHDRVPDVLRRWHVSVIPSVCESFGIAALESSAMGIPVVASAVGGLRETVLGGETGVHVPVGDSEAIAEAVTALLDDRDRARAMGEAGRRYVEGRFEWNDCMSQWLRFFERAASNPRPVFQAEPLTPCGFAPG